MALSDFVSNVLTRYRADTTDHKRAIKKLRGEQRKLAKQQLEDVEKQNKKLDDQIAMWGKVTAGVVAAAGAYKAVTASVDTFVEVSRLQANTVGVNIQALVEESDGLINKFDAMRLAAKNLTGQFPLTQKELENVAAGVTGLVREGKSLENVLDRTGQAIREGNVEPLKELGITIKDVENDSVEAVQKIAEVYGAKGAGLEQAVDDVVRSQSEFRESLTDLKVEAGEFAAGPLADMTKELAAVVELGTEFLSLDFGGVLGFAGRSFDGLGAKARELGEDLLFALDPLERIVSLQMVAGLARPAPPESATNKQAERMQRERFLRENPDIARRIASRQAAREGEAMLGSLGGMLGDIGAAVAAGREGRRIRGAATLRDFAEAQERRIEELRRARERRGPGLQLGLGPLAGQLAGGIPAGLGGILGGVESLADERQQQQALAAAQQQRELDALSERASVFGAGGAASFRDEVLGPMREDESQRIRDTASAALQGSQAFGMFANSANTAFQSVIAGSMSMRDAFKKVLGDMIMGKAFDAFSDALLSTGKALFAFATPGGQASGAAFAASAAKNFAIAATLGGIAKRFGAGGSAPGGGGAGNVGPSVRRARDDRGDRTFIFGSDFLDESPLERSRRFRRIRSHAEGTTDDGAELL